MTHEVFHGSSSREPVFSGTRRVRGLHQRRRRDGSIVFEARLRIDGRDRWITLDAKTKTDAFREHEALRVDRDRGEQRHRSCVPTLNELAPEYLDGLQARVGIQDERRRYSQRTVDLYRGRLRDHVLPVLGSSRVDELRVEDVRRLVDLLSAKGLAPGTVTSCLNILSGLLRFALKRKLAAHNVVRDLDRDDRPGAGRVSEPRYLSVAEVERLLAAMTDTFRPVGVVCVFLGLRISEALGLRWRDLDFDAETIAVKGQLAPTGERIPWTKTPASTATGLPMLPVVRRELGAHRSRQASLNLALVRPDALVFTTLRGKPQSRRNALRAVHTAGDNIGLNGEGVEKVGLHDLRHSFVAAAFENGGDHREVAEAARHANGKVTLTIYGGLTDDGRGRAFAKLAKGGFGA